MPKEVLHWLQPTAGGIYLDGTLGGAGHSCLILEVAAESRLIGLDRDPTALQEAAEKLACFGARVSLHHATFDQAGQVLNQLGVAGLDGMLLDLGVSSHQLDTPQRGFSFRHDAPLDMRMNPTTGITAADVVNQADEAELIRIFFEYGEERYSRRIVRKIVAQREDSPLTTTDELAELVRQAVPGGWRQQNGLPCPRHYARPGSGLRLDQDRGPGRRLPQPRLPRGPGHGKAELPPPHRDRFRRLRAHHSAFRRNRIAV